MALPAAGCIPVCERGKRAFAQIRKRAGCSTLPRGASLASPASWPPTLSTTPPERSRSGRLCELHGFLVDQCSTHDLRSRPRRFGRGRISQVILQTGSSGPRHAGAALSLADAENCAMEDAPAAIELPFRSGQLGGSELEFEVDHRARRDLAGAPIERPDNTGRVVSD